MSAIEQIYWLIILATGLIAATNPNRGILLTVVIGFIQDPIRKLVPGQPVYMIASLLIPFVGALWGTFATSAVSTTRNFFRLYPPLLLPTQICLVLVFFQIVNAYLFSGNFEVVIIGIINYIMPLFALLVAFQFASDKSNAMWLITIYIAGATILAIGSVANLYGIEGVLTETVGVDLFVYDETGRKSLRAGFFRAPEIAGHHCAVAVILLIVMIFHRKILHRPDIIILLFIATTILTIGITLAGRRKTLFQIALFLAVYFPVLRLTMREKAQVSFSTAVFIIALVAIGLWIIGAIEDTSSFGSVASDRFTQFSEREFSGRTSTMLVDAPLRAIEFFGIFGAGAGMLSQGMANIWTPAMLLDKELSHIGNLWFYESGLGRLAGEFGIIGLVVIATALVTLYRVYYSTARYVNHKVGYEYPLFVGLSLLIGIIQPLNFLLAAQIYSDPFVVISLALFVGVALAVPTWTSQSNN